MKKYIIIAIKVIFKLNTMIKEWHGLNIEIQSWLDIQHDRKIKSIIDTIYDLGLKLDPDLGCEWDNILPYERVIIAWLNKLGYINYGSNLEFCWKDDNTQFWDWLEKVHNNPALEDN
jgi:hypothetical protein